MSRTVICYDMDMYFAAVAIRDNPSLKDKPLVIGSLPGERGVVSTASYEARASGVKTAMSVNEALTLCPHLKMLSPNYPLYHDLSSKLKNLLMEEIPLIEQFSIDEFFGDVTGYINENEIVDFAYKLKKRIFPSKTF